MKMAIVGGGIGGLTMAYLLAKEKHQVKLFEKTDILGGLARTTNIGGKQIEVYYHHYNKGNSDLFSLCKELGIGIEWFNAKMGYLSKGKIYDFDNVIDLWNFKPLRLRDKLSLIESCFFNLNSSKEVYETLWKPLLIQKFGKDYGKITMQWIWSRPKCNGKLAYIKGSTQVLIDKLKEKILELGGEIILEQELDKDKYNYILDTTPKKVEMLPVTSVLLLLDRPLTKYYWLNIGDLSFPFGLVVQKDNYVYLTKYGEAAKDFIKHLVRINPEFNKTWIKETQVFKDEYAQEKFPAVEDRGLNNVIKKVKKTILCI